MLFTLCKPPFSFLACFSFCFSLQLSHRVSDHVPHVLLRFPSSFWSNSDDPAPCLSTSSISVTPVNSPGSRLSVGALIPPPSKSGLLKPVSESSNLRPHVTSIPYLKRILVECVLHVVLKKKKKKQKTVYLELM